MLEASSTSSPKTEWGRNDLESVSECPVCRSNRRQLAYEGLTDRVFGCAPGRWNLFCCDDCKSAYLDPRPTISSIALAYSSYYTHAAETGAHQKALSWRKRRRIAQRNRYLNLQYGYDLQPASGSLFFLKGRQRQNFDRYASYLRFPGTGARLLDVGCGNGSLLLRMQSLGWNVCGVEPDPKSAELGRAAGLDVRVGLLPQVDLPEAHFDAVILSHVIEHLHDPLDTLSRCSALLKPGGKFVIFTPNYGAIGREHFGAAWLGLDPPRHLVLFNEKSLRESMERCGFSVSRGPKGYTWWRESCSLSRGEVGPAPLGRLPWHLCRYCDFLEFKADRAIRADPSRVDELILIGTKLSGDAKR